MYKYDNPALFRQENSDLYEYVHSHFSLFSVYQHYCDSMFNYFMTGEYEFRKRALYYKRTIQNA